MAEISSKELPPTSDQVSMSSDVPQGLIRRPSIAVDSNRLSTPTAGLPQLVEEIQHKLIKGTVECMICYENVSRSAPIWSCSCCFSIFHLHCIKKWARAPSAEGLTWGCPGCRSEQLISSKDIRYVCFCGKRPDPPWDRYLTPHSCGEPCEKEIARDDLCRHRCVLQCHPGPCPPCQAYAPPRVCPCGKKVLILRCSDQNSITCGQPCGKPLECLRHYCEKSCHVGPCDFCDILLADAYCFCKKKTEAVVCGQIMVKGQVNAEADGIFSCSLPCGKPLACGNHVCKETCHPGVCGDCDLLPARVTSCSCGKTSSLQEEKPRYSCLDPIPTCSEICGKTLPCGLHCCKVTCHPGPCPPCQEMVTKKCRCGSTSRSVECFNTTMEFTCERTCGRQISCGRHHCIDKCCPLLNSNNVPHLCSKPCKKKLRCGQHDCGLLCHSGHCPPCSERIFNELTCACGRSSILPPLTCGTPPPPCQHPCSVPQPCGHVASHSCHFGDCPPCSALIPKKCIGGHVVLKNIPCFKKDIRCNNPCGKRRQCGMHDCLRTCHPAPCDSTTGKASCGQTCDAPRRDCSHRCTSLCHPYDTCPDVTCEFPVTITCGCGRITATVPCDAGGDTCGYSADYVHDVHAVLKLPLEPVEAKGKKIPLGQRKLMCDDQCVKTKCTHVLADAFGGSNSNVGENTDVLEDLIQRNPKWVMAVEERCKMLVVGGGGGRGSRGGVNVHVFCPMLKEKRDEIRVIAERWNLWISDAGREPKRFIVVHVTPKSKAPSRVIRAKGSHPLTPSFDPLVDMDPRLVALFDRPTYADVSALVLRFGGECQLVWLKEKSALVVFSDPVKTATARQLAHGTAYYGATSVSSLSSSSGNAWDSSAANP